MLETGFYMTSFAATIFIAALVTIGVLFITLLIALTVMLQSCQSRSAGVIQSQKSDYDYNKCEVLVMHAELNNLESGHIPIVCRVPTVLYIKEGQYARDLNSTMLVVENYFSIVSPLNDGLDMVLVDIDDILSSNHQNANILLQRYFLVPFKTFSHLDCSSLGSHIRFLTLLDHSKAYKFYKGLCFLHVSLNCILIYCLKIDKELLPFLSFLIL